MDVSFTEVHIKPMSWYGWK